MRALIERHQGYIVTALAVLAVLVVLANPIPWLLHEAGVHFPIVAGLASAAFGLPAFLAGRGDDDDEPGEDAARGPFPWMP